MPAHRSSVKLSNAKFIFGCVHFFQKICHCVNCYAFSCHVILGPIHIMTVSSLTFSAPDLGARVGEHPGKSLFLSALTTVLCLKRYIKAKMFVGGTD